MMVKLHSDYYFIKRTPELSLAFHLGDNSLYQFKDHNALIANGLNDGNSLNEIVEQLQQSGFEFEGVELMEYTKNFLDTLVGLGIFVQVK